MTTNDNLIERLQQVINDLVGLFSDFSSAVSSPRASPERPAPESGCAPRAFNPDEKIISFSNYVRHRSDVQLSPPASHTPTPTTALGRNNPSQIQQTNDEGVLKFSLEEIKKMPKTFKKVFMVDGKVCHIRKRTDGRYKCSYEIRYSRDGYYITASGVTLEIAKARFLDKLKTARRRDEQFLQRIPGKFQDFALYWFENFHRRRVCEKTYLHNMAIYNKHIKDYIGNNYLVRLTPVLLQHLLDGLADRHRIQEDCFCILNQIFTCAMNHGILRVNPVSMIFYQTKERVHGVALSKDEERKLLEFYDGKPEQTIFALFLYTGMRPNELETATIEGEFIKAVNSKRKRGKVEYKRIPINPMLAPYLDGVKRLPKMHLMTLGRRFKDVLPGHRFYDMRTTFQTRCTECGLSDTVIGLFMGNSIGKMKETYTDLSDEYLCKEASKLKY